MSLVARHLEADGIATVVVGSARDVVEEAGVARFVFVDFPLGNPTGKPGDDAMHRDITKLALDVVASAIAPRTTVQAPQRWGSDDWREAFMSVDEDALDELRAAGERRRAHQASDRG